MKAIPRLAQAFLALAIFASAACTSSATPDCLHPDVFCVGLVSAEGGLAFNPLSQQTWDALQMASAKDGFRAELLETVNFRDYRKNIAHFADSNYDVIITSGYELGDHTQWAAARWPNTLFIGIEQAEIKKMPKNLAVITFPTQRAGQMAGALAGLVSTNGKVGAVLPNEGMSAIQSYGDGFTSGAKQANVDASAVVRYNNKDGFSTSYQNVEWGAENAYELITQDGVDVLFAYGGETARAALQEAAKNNIWLIGGEYHQYSYYPEIRRHLLASIVPVARDPVLALVRRARRGEFKAGVYKGTYQYIFPAPLPAPLTPAFFEKAAQIFGTADSEEQPTPTPRPTLPAPDLEPTNTPDLGPTLPPPGTPTE